jgi:hypothetical protein
MVVVGRLSGACAFARAHAHAPPVALFAIYLRSRLVAFGLVGLENRTMNMRTFCSAYFGVVRHARRYARTR